MLGYLVGGIYLKEDRCREVSTLAHLGDLLGKVKAIDRMDQGKTTHDFWHFFGLQSADEVPVDLLRQLRHLNFRLLKVAFAKVFLARFIKPADRFDRLAFGDCDEANGIWFSIGREARSLNLCFKFLQGLYP